MKKRSVTTSLRPVTVVPRFILALSLYLLLSLWLAAPAAATVVAPSQCDPARGLTFACLGEALNYMVLGPGKETSENMQRFNGDLTISLLNSVNVLLAGTGYTSAGPTISGGNPSLARPYNPYIEGGGAIGTLALAIGTVYTHPPGRLVDKKEFLQQTLANNLLNPQPALAQGPGLDLLRVHTGMIGLWYLMRNIAYLALAATLGIFGLMVMFRAKADPRTVVTFQMALPRIAVALVLIYFSLPIAGLLYDVAEVGMRVVQGFFCKTGSCPLPAPLGHTGDWPIFADFGQMWNNFVSPLGGLKFQVNTGTPIDPLINLLILFFAFSVVLRIFWTLISRYTVFILQALFGPVFFLLGTLPGQEESPMRWVKGLLVSALTFPGVYLVINLANFIRVATTIPFPLGTTGGFTGGAVSAQDLSGLLAIGVLSIAPKIPAMLEEMFDIVPGAHAARAGAEPSGLLRGIPVIGHMMG